MTGGRHERHYVGRTGWLRAAVLGANDGILSTGSLILGVAAASGGPRNLVLTGLAGLVAGAMSMAAGEFVSVSSQADSEKADLAREQRELEDNRPAERRELTEIYVDRGVEEALAAKVAEQLMAKDALAAHAQDELGISVQTKPRPLQAAYASAAAFSAGAALPVLMTVFTPRALLIPVTAAACLVFLAVLGAVGAKAGGASIGKAMLRVVIFGAAAMAVTTVIGALVGGAV
jgi:VIT1/CCC1 family predicted Fe2+/Mn2+ transporter